MNIKIKIKKKRRRCITSRVVSIISLDCSYLFRNEFFIFKKLFESFWLLSLISIY